MMNKPFIFFPCFYDVISIGHRANDSFMGIYITELGGNEGLVGLAWFIGVISEDAICICRILVS